MIEIESHCMNWKTGVMTVKKFGKIVYKKQIINPKISFVNRLLKIKRNGN